MRNSLCLLCLLAAILCGCVKDTTLDAGQERRVVVEFVLTEDSVQNLYLSLTGEPGEKEAPAVQKAGIRLIDITRSKELNRDIEFLYEYAGRDLYFRTAYTLSKTDREGFATVCDGGKSQAEGWKMLALLPIMPSFSWRVEF